MSAVTENTKAAVEDAGRSARSKIEQLWEKIDQARLKNRTRDEVVGWAIMGLLVGGLLHRTAGMNALGAFGFGLLGALLGGIVVKLAELDFGLGPVLIRYEDLVLSFFGALLIVLAAKWFTGKPKQKT